MSDGVFHLNLEVFLRDGFTGIRPVRIGNTHHISIKGEHGYPALTIFLDRESAILLGAACEKIAIALEPPKPKCPECGKEE